MEIIERSSKQVSRGILFYHYHHHIIFACVYANRSGRKTFSSIGLHKNIYPDVDAMLVVTLAPVIISFFMKGKFTNERKNPINRFLERIYEPVIQGLYEMAKNNDRYKCSGAAYNIPLLMSLGSEFMPPLDEQSIFSCR